MSRLRALRGEQTRAFVVCQVGQAHYALPVEEVQEIIQPLVLTTLPHAPAGIIGAVEHREVVIPILDLGDRLGFGVTSASRRKWVLMRAKGRSLGLVVGQVHEVFEVPHAQLRPAPEVGDARLRGAKQVVNYKGGMAFLLDMTSVADLAEMPRLSDEQNAVSQ